MEKQKIRLENRLLNVFRRHFSIQLGLLSIAPEKGAWMGNFKSQTYTLMDNYTSSYPANQYPISNAAVSSASEPWMAFS
jgi:hypothetical protein